MKASATGSMITVNIDGKPLEKLIEVVSNGIGTLYRPRKIRKEADAQAYAIKVVEKAKAEAEADSMLIEAETVERIGQRLIAQEIRRQNNIDTVVEAAADDLKGKDVSEEPVSEDWSTRFFGIVQDVSQEEMKVIWAKILAKEIERPSTFSVRTLETLRNLSTKEAELFEKISPYILNQNDYFIYNDPEVLEKYGISFMDIAQLTECGMLQTGDFVSKNYKGSPEIETVSAIFYGKYIIMMKLPKAPATVDIPVILLSQAGRELFGLLEPEADMDYIREFSQYVKKKDSRATIQYAEFINIEAGRVHYKLPIIDL